MAETDSSVAVQEMNREERSSAHIDMMRLAVQCRKNPEDEASRQELRRLYRLYFKDLNLTLLHISLDPTEPEDKLIIAFIEA